MHCSAALAGHRSPFSASTTDRTARGDDDAFLTSSVLPVTEAAASSSPASGPQPEGGCSIRRLSRGAAAGHQRSCTEGSSAPSLADAPAVTKLHGDVVTPARQRGGSSSDGEDDVFPSNTGGAAVAAECGGQRRGEAHSHPTDSAGASVVEPPSSSARKTVATASAVNSLCGSDALQTCRGRAEMTASPAAVSASVRSALLPAAAQPSGGRSIPVANRRRGIRRSGGNSGEYLPQPQQVRLPASRGLVFALLERSARQRWRSGWAVLLEVAVPLLFVAVSIVLWSVWGTESVGEQTPLVSFYATRHGNGVAVAGAEEDTDICVIASDNATQLTERVGGFAPCNRTSMNWTSYDCSLDLSLLPMRNVSLCVAFWKPSTLVAYDLLRYLGQLALVPTLDVIIKMQWLALAAGKDIRTLAYPALSGMTVNTRYSSILCSGNLYFVGDSSTTPPLIAHLNATSALFRYVSDGAVYGSVAAAQAAAEGQRVWAIVELKQMDALGLDLVLHMNNSALPSFSKAYTPTYSGGAEYDSVELYVVSGYLTLQKMISDYYLATQTGTNVTVPFYISSFPTPPYTRLPLLTNARQAIPLVFVLAFLYSVAQQAKETVLEKELRIREAMLIMGMKQWAIYVSDFLIQLPINVVVCALSVAMLHSTFVIKSDPFILFLLFFVFSLTTIPLSGIIAAFFSRAHLALLVTPVVYSILVIPAFAMTNVSGAAIIGVSTLSPSAFSAVLTIYFQYETGSGCGSAELNNHRDNPTMAVLLGMLAADFAVYYVLMLYLDAVVPKEWGTPRHPLFFVLEPLRWCRGTKPARLEGGADGRAENGVFETTEYADDVVSFDGLRKEYSRAGKTFVAVNNLYWGMREDEISVLLGHNGAGKTTLLNMMTGMVESDEGDCYIYGHSVRTQKSRVRQLLGFCPQHNILWDELTCRDHLEFYGKIKGLKGWELENAICRMLFETDLLDKMDVASKQLSGGMKRKLSIAVAFVGGSQLVFLDEPTAGLDVGARRHVWELLQRMAQRHTILLTTHYMDEADLLGSRIGIMSQGRLKCSGSSLFLKSRLGVGYNLDISVHANVKSSEIDALVLRSVKGAVVLGQNGSELSYQLPSRSVQSFPALLNEIDSNQQEGIRGYSVAATTLEEVFLKVSEEDMPDRTTKIATEELHSIWTAQRSTSPLWMQFVATLTKRFWNALRDRRMQFFQVVCPVICILIAMLLNLVSYEDKRTLTYTFDMFAAEPVSELLTTQCGPYFGSLPSSSYVTIVNASSYLPDYTYMWSYTRETWFTHDTPRFGALQCDALLLSPFMEPIDVPALYAMYNTSSYHQAPLNSATYYSLFAKTLLGSSVDMTYSAALFERASPPRQLTLIFFGILIMIPFTFLLSVPVAWVVKERQCGSRHLQNLCGLNFFVYWGATFLFDMCAYFLTMLLCIAIFAIFQRTEFIGSDRIGATFALFVVYGLTSTTLGYALSFLFKEYSTAQTVTMGVSFVAGFAFLILVYVLSLDTDNLDVADKMRWGFRAVPSYCIGEGILNLLQLDMKLKLGEATSVWDMDQLGWTLVYMAAELPLLCAVVLLADHPWLGRVVQRLHYHRDATCGSAATEADSDVEAEREAVQKADRSSAAGADVVRLVDLHKTYPNGHTAVKGVSFSILPGEVFGFLGTNGAGKTTTISMLCQQFLPTGGHASICGHDIVSESREALRCIGYCPQFDATLDLLTVEEQLRLYASIRGVVAGEQARLVEALCTLCELTQYRRTVTGELSGGNRRKLSVAMSLVGGPQVLFLDEPSAGMDPVARRGMWTAIQRASAHCSVVLTTHHLEEVEALADTVAIMVRGAVRCIGDKTHLKNKFGSAFELGVLLSSPHYRGRLERFMAKTFPGAVCNESDGRRFVYRLLRDRPLGAIFQAVQAHKEKLHITDYSVSQTSMEQIFLQVEKRALAPEGNDSEGMPARAVGF